MVIVLSTSNLLNYENFAMLVDFSHFFMFSYLRHEDELSTIIAYSLASQEYHDKLQVLGFTLSILSVGSATSGLRF